MNVLICQSVIEVVDVLEVVEGHQATATWIILWLTCCRASMRDFISSETGNLISGRLNERMLAEASTPRSKCGVHEMTEYKV